MDADRPNRFNSHAIKTLDRLPRVMLCLSRPVVEKDERQIVEQRLCFLTENIRRIVDSNSPGIDDRVVQTFSEAIFGILRLRSTRNVEHDESFLGSVLARGVGNCTGLTSVYLAAARTLGVPMFAVFEEGHVQVLYHGSNKDMIIETVRNGRVLNFDGNGHVSRRILNDREFVAVILNNRAAYLHARDGNWIAAARDLRLAVRLFPEHPDVHRNLYEIEMSLAQKR